MILIVKEFTITDKLGCFRASDPKCLYYVEKRAIYLYRTGEMVVGAAFTAENLTEHRLVLAPELTLMSTLCMSVLVITPKTGNYP